MRRQIYICLLLLIFLEELLIIIELKKEDGYHRKYYLSKRPYTEEEILINFINVTSNNNPKSLTTVGFNEVSQYSHIVTVRMLKISWCELLKKHDLVDKLYQYVLDEYKEYCIITGDSNVGNFIKQNKYITQDILKYFKKSKLKSDCGLNTRGNSHEHFRRNFENVMKIVGRIPTYTEFLKFSAIHPQTYYRTYSKEWDSVVRIFVTDENLLIEYENYKMESLLVNAKKGSNKRIDLHAYTEDELKTNFTQIFIDCHEKYGTYPTRRLFNNLSNIKDITYRKRFKKSWLNVCKSYGYSNEVKNISELIVLESIKKILNSEYEPQKTWQWLIGTGGRNMYCDGYFNNHNLVIEFDGVQHRKPVSNMGGEKAFVRRKINDNLKDNLLKEHGINIIRIDSREPWHDLEYLINKLFENNILSSTA